MKSFLPLVLVALVSYSSAIGVISPPPVQPAIIPIPVGGNKSCCLGGNLLLGEIGDIVSSVFFGLVCPPFYLWPFGTISDRLADALNVPCEAAFYDLLGLFYEAQYLIGGVCPIEFPVPEAAASATLENPFIAKAKTTGKTMPAAPKTNQNIILGLPLECPRGFFAYKDRCFKVEESKSLIDWDDAREKCKKQGADLAVLTCEEEEEFIGSMLDDCKEKIAWVGKDCKKCFNKECKCERMCKDKDKDDKKHKHDEEYDEEGHHEYEDDHEDEGEDHQKGGDDDRKRGDEKYKNKYNKTRKCCPALLEKGEVISINCERRIKNFVCEAYNYETPCQVEGILRRLVEGVEGVLLTLKGAWLVAIRTLCIPWLDKVVEFVFAVINSLIETLEEIILYKLPIVCGGLCHCSHMPPPPAPAPAIVVGV